LLGTICGRQSQLGLVAVVVVVAVGAASEVSKCRSSVGHDDAEIWNHLDMVREITVHSACDRNVNGNWDYCAMCYCRRGNGAK